MLMNNPGSAKNQQGFHALFLVVAIVVIGVIAFAGFKVFNQDQDTPSNDQRGANYQALQSCGSEPLNTMPMELSKLEQIAPLGNVDPPDHTLPTDHMYMMYPYGATDQNPIYAPADIVITALSYGDVLENGVQKHGDYRVDFYACSELKIIFGHIDTLSDKITSQIGTPQNPVGAECNSSTQGNSEIKNCSWNVDITLSAGELLGTSDGWDLWAALEGYTSPNVISPDYYHNVDAVCPLDYFTSDLRSQLYSLVKRQVAPKCGEAYQDKANTLQGGWFGHKDPNQAKTDWSSHLSLTHNSVETDVGQLAVAGKIAEQFMYRFTPKHEGTTNREPSETTTNVIYCYQHEGPQRMPNGRIAGTGKVLLQLTDNHTMQVEHQAGSCTASESFIQPSTYYR